MLDFAKLFQKEINSKGNYSSHEIKSKDDITPKTIKSSKRMKFLSKRKNLILFYIKKKKMESKLKTTNNEIDLSKDWILKPKELRDNAEIDLPLIYEEIKKSPKTLDPIVCSFPNEIQTILEKNKVVEYMHFGQNEVQFFFFFQILY